MLLLLAICPSWIESLKLTNLYRVTDPRNRMALNHPLLLLSEYQFGVSLSCSDYVK